MKKEETLKLKDQLKKEIKAELKKEIEAELKADKSTQQYKNNYLSERLAAAGILGLLAFAVVLILTSRYFITGHYDVAATKQLMQAISAVLAISGIGLAVHDQFFFPKLAIIFSLLSAGLAGFSNFLG
ncbi:TPA: hypothetical protein ACMDQ9_004435 [Vibrio parahaemolyticus]|uniref:hypothetical protein n=1 Tax=Vibrio parahaemolyticus TaxID=670 RepID=UPI0010A9ADB4|nr:hypothetical protein [Vibrio parahaemolyticus]THE57755.1 hypothetical protein E4P16_26070 [Vibrio parahaemolyticus]